MANVVFFSGAYRGDVYPYVPVASEMQRRGHNVTYVVPREFHPDFADEPFRCVHSGTDFSPMTLNLPENAEFVRKWGMKANGAFLMRLYICKLTVPHMQLQFDTLKNAAEEADVDLFVQHPGASLLGQIVADAMDVPWISGDLFPMIRPTADHPPPGLPNLGQTANKAMWTAGSSRLTAPLSCHNALMDFRTSIGLSPGPTSAIKAMQSPHGMIGMVSPHYFPVPSDWPDTYQMTGFTHWAGPGSGVLGDDVLRFLDEGPPPVVITLGTAAATAHPEVFGAALDELDKAGERAIVLASTDALAESLRTRVSNGPHAVWPFVPLQALLQRAKAIVHSGAHGTNGLGLAAGLPAVIVPSLFDQVWHGERQEELGTGVLVRKHKDVPAAMTRLLHDTSLADNARAFGQLLQDEDGVTASADAIEGML